MKFQVPQFIEIEDKVFGPMSFRQFAYVAGGIGFCVIAYNLGGFFVAALLGIPILVLSLALAFYRVYNQPFGYTLYAFVNYVINRKLYLWEHRHIPAKQKNKAPAKPTNAQPTSRISENKLRDIAWALDSKKN